MAIGGVSGEAGSGRARWRARRAVATAEPGTEVREQPPGTDEEAPPNVAATPRKRPSLSGSTFVRRNARALGAVALLIVGVVFVVLGWYGAAHTNIFTEQIPYLISGGLLGVALIIVAGFLASSASLERANEQLRHDLTRAMSAMGSGTPNPNGGGSVASMPHDRVYVVAGGHSYHEAGCPIVEGKDASPLPLRKAIDSGYVPCKLCGSD
jgi:hypothetical protein